MIAIKEFVLDCSIAISWCFEDEATLRTGEIHESLAQGVRAFVPSLWHLEIANVFLNAERQNRVKKSDTIRYITLLRKLPIIIDEDTSIQIFSDILPLAREHSLSSYDTVYLELAIRKGISLATNDKQLEKAAKQSNVHCL